MMEIFSSTIALLAAGAWGGIASQRRRAAALPFGVTLAIVAVLGWLALFIAPRDFWLRHAWTVEFFHPYVVTLDSILASLLGAALIVISLTRRA